MDQLKIFDWGNLAPEYQKLYWNENCVLKTYLKHYDIKRGDIVVDLGANVGTFSYSILEQQPLHIYCVEPDVNVFSALRNNITYENSTLINLSIGNSDIDYSSITFETLLKQNNISIINFMKIDCEGCEYYVLSTKNEKIVKSTVKNIAGEYHFNYCSEKSLEYFFVFRDIYMKKAKQAFIYDRNNENLTSKLYDDSFLYDYKQYWDETNYFLNQLIFHVEL